MREATSDRFVTFHPVECSGCPEPDDPTEEIPTACWRVFRWCDELQTDVWEDVCDGCLADAEAYAAQMSDHVVVFQLVVETGLPR